MFLVSTLGCPATTAVQTAVYNVCALCPSVDLDAHLIQELWSLCIGIGSSMSHAHIGFNPFVGQVALYLNSTKKILLQRVLSACLRGQEQAHAHG